MQRFQEKLEQLKTRNRYRHLTLPDGLDLSSNDYLGLSAHPELRNVAIIALEAGLEIGAEGSRLLRGHKKAHQDLEEFAAEFFGYERSLFLASGFQANYTLFTSLPDRHDIVIYDSLIHASVRDGINASPAKSIKLKHNDLNDYEAALKRAAKICAGQIYIAVESIYSMDGDRAPLVEIYDMACKFDAVLIVDEAHATGVWGADGKGLADLLPRENVITVHTCGKALGVAGGLICASVDVIEYMINTARGFIYSTAPMPLQALLVQESLKIIASADGQKRREGLHSLCGYVQEKIGGAGSQIVPIIIGDDARAVEIASAMQAAGFDIRAVRPPSVPEGSARLRLSLSSQLDRAELDRFLDCLTAYLQDIAA